MAYIFDFQLSQLKSIELSHRKEMIDFLGAIDSLAPLIDEEKQKTLDQMRENFSFSHIRFYNERRQISLQSSRPEELLLFQEHTLSREEIESYNNRPLSIEIVPIGHKMYEQIFRNIKGKAYLILRQLKSDIFSSQQVQTGLYAILDPSGKILQGSERFDTLFGHTSFAKYLSPSNTEMVTSLTLEKKNYLMSTKKSEIGPYFFTSLIPSQEAFEVTNFLIEKSLYYGLAIVSLVIIIAILFSRKMTSHLDTLLKSTMEVRAGNFDLALEIKSHDEFKTLADSFQLMASRIKELLKEVRSKAILEAEMELAKTVQKSYIPHGHFQLEGGWHLTAFYSPAGACSGDWWAHYDDREISLFLVADGTGHGISAALMTATLHSSWNLIKRRFAIDPSLRKRPDLIMEQLNQAMYTPSAPLSATCCILCVVKADFSLLVSNASHQVPLALVERAPHSLFEKSHLSPLLVPPGPPLGIESSSTYQMQLFQNESYIHFFLFSDGMLEALNAKGRPFGERNFYGSLLDSLNQKISPTKNLFRSIKNYMGASEQEDDFTIVHIERAQ